MTDEKKDRREPGRQAPSDGPTVKKPYVPPRVVSHDALEVITGACSPEPPAKASAGSCSLSQS